jgi:hypothetical protein
VAVNQWPVINGLADGATLTVVDYILRVLLGVCAGSVVSLALLATSLALALVIVGMVARAYRSITRRMDRVFLLGSLAVGSYVAFVIAGYRLEAACLTCACVTYAWRRFVKPALYT